MTTNSKENARKYYYKYKERDGFIKCVCCNKDILKISMRHHIKTKKHIKNEGKTEEDKKIEEELKQQIQDLQNRLKQL